MSYAALVYHLPLLIGFSFSQRAKFVWGGCMLFPLPAMVNDTYGIMQVGCDLHIAFAPALCATERLHAVLVQVMVNSPCSTMQA